MRPCNGELLWRGRLGDGRALTIDRCVSGEVVFTYSDIASFSLDQRGWRLECAPSDDRLDWQRVLIGKVIPSIAVMRGYEALHAGAVDSPEGVVAIAGPSGAGKSTLALELMRRGWPLFADDELTLERQQDGVYAHHGAPHMTVSEACEQPEQLGTVLGVLAGERWVVAHDTATATRPVRMICLLQRGRGISPGAQPLPANPLLLAPYMLGLSSDTERQRARFGLYADLVDAAHLVKLSGSASSTAGQLADLVEAALAESSTCSR